MKDIKIGIIGSGIVGQVLAKGFLQNDYDVMIGSRTPKKLEGLRSQNEGKLKTGTFAETAFFGTILILATKGMAAMKALQMAGSENLRGKTIIDATNPIADEPPVNGVLRFFTSLEESLMEQLQKSFPESNFVKSFSCVGNALMVNPDFGGIKPTIVNDPYPLNGLVNVAQRDSIPSLNAMVTYTGK
jgi:hypothetical protein